MKPALFFLAISLGFVACGGVERTSCYAWGDDCSGKDGEKGDTGKQGQTGEAGANGEDGTSCSVERVEEGALITCENGSQVLVKDGKDGEDGEDGEKGETGLPGADGSSSKVTFVDPCPTAQTAYPELLLCVDDQLYGLYGAGSQVAIYEVPAGTYQTRDKRRCTYTVTSGCSVN
jgi:hypothetical protein